MNYISSLSLNTKFGAAWFIEFLASRRHDYLVTFQTPAKIVPLTVRSHHLNIFNYNIFTQCIHGATEKKLKRFIFYLLAIVVTCTWRFWFLSLVFGLIAARMQFSLVFVSMLEFYFMPKWGGTEDKFFLRRHNTQHQYEMNEKVFVSTVRPFH